MIPLVERNREELGGLCRRFGVAQLEIFGSAAESSSNREAADLDFLVDFERRESMDLAEQYFGLLFALQDLFGREIDLLTPRSLRNPYFIREVDRTRQVLYAA